MNKIQRVILILVAFIVLIGGIVTIISPTITFIQYFAYLFIVVIAALLFYFGFSPPKRRANRRSTDVQSSQLFKKTDEVPIFSQKKDTPNSQKLQNLVDSTNKRLYKISTVSPFKLFPSDVIIEQRQVVIVNRFFFYARRDFPILVKNILVPIVECNMFFASFSMEVVGYEQNPASVNFLKKTEAMRAKTIIMGLIVCDKEGIDLSQFSTAEILSKVEEIGKVRIT